MKLNDRINTRIDKQLKNEANQVFQLLGITEGEAIRIFYAQVALHHGLPFPLHIPNKTTLKTMKEGEKTESLLTFENFSEIRQKAGI